MHIDIVPNRNSKPTVLLRKSYREGGKVRKRTLANLSALPPESIEAVRHTLRGTEVRPVGSLIRLGESRQLGNVQAVKTAMERLGVAELLSARPCRERSVVMAVLAQRLIRPETKLATAAAFGDTVAPEAFKLPAGADEDDIYGAMDWLLARQPRIERKLAARHLRRGGMAFYDLSCSSYHGTHCPLARFGHNRDKLPLRAVEYGLLTDGEGRPVSVGVYAGDTSDPATVPGVVEKVRKDFGLGDVTVVGDRGMLTGARIDAIRKREGVRWITCLRSGDVRRLIEERDPSDTPLFTRTGLAEVKSELFPGERLVVCFNPFLQEDRRRTRDELLAATEEGLARVRRNAARRTRKPYADAELGGMVGAVLDRHKMRKHFNFEVKDGRLDFSRNEASIERERGLDGFYVIRTNVPEKSLGAADAVRAYKSLGNVEKAFRTMKGLDIRVRPIHHRLDGRVRAHVFLCMLAYYVEWHMRRALSTLLYAEDDLPAARAARDPVARALPTDEARRKKSAKKSADGFGLSNWRGIMDRMSTLMRTTVHFDGCDKPVQVDHMPTPYQARVLELLKAENPVWDWRRRQPDDMPQTAT